MDPHLIIRVADASLALPISVVDRLEEEEETSSIDLGWLTRLCDTPEQRPKRIALKTAAGLVVVGIDEVGELVSRVELLPLPQVTRVQPDGIIVGLLSHNGYSVVLDGASLGDLLAEHVLREEK